MKRLILTAASVLAVLALAEAALAESGVANRSLNIQVDNFQDYGFESKLQMEQYFAVDEIEVSESLLTQFIDATPGTVPAPTTGTAPAPAPTTGTAPAPTQPTLPNTTPPQNNPKPQGNTPAPGTTPGGAPGGIGKDVIAVITDPESMQNWVVLGQKIWDIIVANKPVANVSSKRISVLPLAEADWAKMSNWQSPYAKTYKIAARNGFGANVVTIEYTVAFNYGGKFEGRGQYLANATVIPSRVDVAWGFTTNANVEMGTVLNTGSFGEPVPAVDMQLKWKIDSVLKHMEGIDTFFVRGDGVSQRITSSIN